jgi:pseudouridine synthase
MMRINRYLASCGIASRRAAEALVLAGRITVNGSVVTSLATRVDENTDKVTLDGQPLQQSDDLVYVLLNKPKGYITTASDERGRPTVIELVPVPQRIFPVGRLDYNTTGLLLLTNDGELAFRLTHPRFKVPKLYHARLDRDFAPEHFASLTQGVALEDGITQPCQAHFYTSSRKEITVELREGRQQQVRRMFAALGYTVKALNRIRFGPLNLGDLSRGGWRHLDKKEVQTLRAAVGLA